MLFSAMGDLSRAVVNGTVTRSDLERMSKTKGLKGEFSAYLLRNYDEAHHKALREKWASDEKEATQKRALIELEKKKPTLAQDYKSYVKLSIEKREESHVFWELLKEMKAQYQKGDSIASIAHAIPARFLNDSSLAIELIRVHAEFTAYLPQHLKNDEDFLYSALAVNRQCFQFFPMALRNDAEWVAPILAKEPLLLKDCGPSIQGNQSLVEACIQLNPLSFQYASEALRAKASIHVGCIEKNPLLITFVPPHSLTEELVLKALHHPDRQSLLAQAKMAQSRSLQLTPKSKDPKNSQTTKKGKKGLANHQAKRAQQGQYDWTTHVKATATHHTQQDAQQEALIRISNAQHTRSSKQAQEQLSVKQAERRLLKEPKQYQRLASNLKENQSLIRLALSQNGLLLEHVPQHVMNPYLVKLAVNQNPFALSFVPKEMKSERLVVDAMLQQPKVIYFS